MTGPFAEEIILDMWRRGQIQQKAQVCLEETEDWLDARFLVNEMAIEKERAAKARQGVTKSADQMLWQNVATCRQKEKSAGLAFLLNLLVPGLGALYCGGCGMAILHFCGALAMGFLVSIIAAALELGLFQVALTMVAWLIIGAAGYDAAKRHNKTIWDKMPR
jgi:hypothetical protein